VYFPNQARGRIAVVQICARGAACCVTADDDEQLLEWPVWIDRQLPHSTVVNGARVRRHRGVRVPHPEWSRRSARPPLEMRRRIADTEDAADEPSG
jgi:hypothetical protein